MKRIINGKLYDTETAEQVGEYWNGCGCSDFEYLNEVLYRKKTGEFFLHGDGGPMTKYAESCGSNQTSGSEQIIPFTVEEAKEWAEEYMDADSYIKVFGEVSE